jgi:hypothetical protein
MRWKLNFIFLRSFPLFTPRVQENVFIRIFRFYYDGFRSMTVGRRLWLIILIKLFVFFILLRLFFFPDFLKSRFDTDRERGEYVLEQLTQ